MNCWVWHSQRQSKMYSVIALFRSALNERSAGHYIIVAVKVLWSDRIRTKLAARATSPRQVLFISLGVACLYAPLDYHETAVRYYSPSWSNEGHLWKHRDFPSVSSSWVSAKERNGAISYGTIQVCFGSSEIIQLGDHKILKPGRSCMQLISELSKLTLEDSAIFLGEIAHWQARIFHVSFVILSSNSNKRPCLQK